MVNYSLGPPSGVAPGGSSSSTAFSGSPGGLYRTDTDRMAFYSQVQQGQTDPTMGAVEETGRSQRRRGGRFEIRLLRRQHGERRVGFQRAGQAARRRAGNDFDSPCEKVGGGRVDREHIHGGTAKDATRGGLLALIDLPNASVPTNELNLEQVDPMPKQSSNPANGTKSAPAP